MESEFKTLEHLVRTEVRRLLDAAPAFAKLDPDARRPLADSMTEVACALVPAEKLDVPGFVSDLIRGTFEAIVDASIQQMAAYADLLGELAKSVDAFKEDNITDDQARDYLTIQGLASAKQIDAALFEKLAVPAARRELAGRRQHLLATMVLMGINRIVVTDGKIRPKVKTSDC